MCGIVCASLFKRENNNDIIAKTIAYLFSTLMVETQSRGGDATGVLLHYDNGDWDGMKAGIEASKLIGNSYSTFKSSVLFTNVYEEEKVEELPEDMQNYESFIRSRWINKEDTAVRTIIGHCRKATKGTNKNNNNNHPIIAPPIIGVHNGKIENDDIVFELHKGDFQRDGEVDSEAIFKIMSALHPEEGIGDQEYIQTVASSLQIGSFHKDGTAAVAMHEDHPGVLYAFRKGDRPLEICFSKELGVVFIISEQNFLKKNMLQFILSDICMLGFPMFNFEYKTIIDYRGLIIDTNKELTPDMKIVDIMEDFDIKRVIDTNYKKPEPKPYVAPTTHSTHATPVTNPAVKTYPPTATDDTEDEDVKEIMTVLDVLLKNNLRFSSDHTDTGSFTYIPVDNEIEETENKEEEPAPLDCSQNVTDYTKDGGTPGVKVVDTINKTEEDPNSHSLTEKQRFILKEVDVKRFMKFRQAWDKEGLPKKYYSLLKKQFGQGLEMAFDLRTEQINTLKDSTLWSLKRAAKIADLKSKEECVSLMDQLLAEHDINKEALYKYLGFNSFNELVDEIIPQAKTRTEYFQG